MNAEVEALEQEAELSEEQLSQISGGTLSETGVTLRGRGGATRTK